MDDQAKFQRLLEILMKISGSVGYSVKQLSEDFETSERTIYRYLNTFKNAGFVLDIKNSYIRIDKKSSNYKDLSKLIHFSEEEAHILSRAIHLIDDGSKLKHDLYEKLYRLFDSDSAVNKIVKKEKSENVIQLKGAISNKQQVVLKGYRSSNSDSVRDRLMEPFALTSNYLYVWCYDVSNKSNKIFKVARITEVNITKRKWKNEARHKKSETDVFRISGDKKIPVQFKMNMLAYNLLTEEYPLADNFLSKGRDGKYIFDGWVCDYKGVGRFILGLPGETEVLNPPALKAYLSQKIKN
jgi:predicted DNA-binding transcriptional regulator YafY